MMDVYLREKGVKSVLIPALDYMKIDSDDNPDLQYIKQRLSNLLDKYPKADVYITQGYICRNARGAVDNLHRGGSDYSASLIGAAIDAEEIEIWTDIDGMHNNDPRYVEGTRPVEKIEFRRSGRIGIFWSEDIASRLHPTCKIEQYTGALAEHAGSIGTGDVDWK